MMIGILILAYHSPHMTGRYNPLTSADKSEDDPRHDQKQYNPLYTPNNKGVFHCSNFTKKQIPNPQTQSHHHGTGMIFPIDLPCICGIFPY